jgi:hypothetical protein
MAMEVCSILESNFLNLIQHKSTLNARRLFRLRKDLRERFQVYLLKGHRDLHQMIDEGC